MKTLTLYHNDSKRLDPKDLTFVPNFAHVNGGELGFGVYATPDQSLANSYGAFQTIINYDLTKCLSLTTRQLTDNQVRSLLYRLNAKTDYLSNYGDPSSTTESHLATIAQTALLDSNDNDVDLINDLANGSGAPEIIARWLVGHGFNATYNGDDDRPIYALYDEHQFQAGTARLQ